MRWGWVGWRHEGSLISKILQHFCYIKCRQQAPPPRWARRLGKNVQWCIGVWKRGLPLLMWSIFSKLQQTHHSSPRRLKYKMSIVSRNFDPSLHCCNIYRIVLDRHATVPTCLWNICEHSSIIRLLLNVILSGIQATVFLVIEHQYYMKVEMLLKLCYIQLFLTVNTH